MKKLILKNENNFMPEEKQIIKTPVLIKIIVYWWSINALYLLIKSIATGSYDLYLIPYILLLLGGSTLIKMRRLGFFIYIALFLLVVAAIAMSAISYGSLTGEMILSLTITIISAVILTFYYEKFE